MSRNTSEIATFSKDLSNGKFYGPGMSNSLFNAKFKFFMSYEYLEKSANDSNCINY